MDTDDLSNETYEAILVTSEQFHHDLTLQFGILADSCDDDDDYLKQAKLLILEWKSDLIESLDDIFFDETPTAAAFQEVLANIESKIEEVAKIPLEKRSFDLYETDTDDEDL